MKNQLDEKEIKLSKKIFFWVFKVTIMALIAKLKILIYHQKSCNDYNLTIGYKIFYRILNQKFYIAKNKEWIIWTFLECGKRFSDQVEWRRKLDE